MKKLIVYTISFLFISNLQAQLSSSEVNTGLKDALSISCKNAVKKASEVDGFNGNELVRISFPPEAQKMESTLIQMGMEQQVKDFTVSLNRAAETASKEAATVFIAAISEMSFEDGKAILAGGHYAATEYMAQKTTQELYVKFHPIVNNALQKAKVNDYWSPLASTYNKIPFVEKMNPDLVDYTTNKCIEGIFKLMALEEEKMRTLGAARG